MRDQIWKTLTFFKILPKFKLNVRLFGVLFCGGFEVGKVDIELSVQEFLYFRSIT